MRGLAGYGSAWFQDFALLPGGGFCDTTFFYRV